MSTALDDEAEMLSKDAGGSAEAAVEFLATFVVPISEGVCHTRIPAKDEVMGAFGPDRNAQSWPGILACK